MNYVYLKHLSNEELEELKKEVEKESRQRNALNERLCYENDCKGSSNYHFRKYKHWAKLVTEIDTSKNNGYAFIGEFLSITNQDLVPLNSLVVERCGNALKCYRITSNGKKLITNGSVYNMVNFIARVNQEL